MIQPNAYESIAYLCSQSWNESMLGLDRVFELLDKLGNPQKKLKFVHIAGTNGKGSTAAMTESILRKAGYKTGLYTSPYIHRFNERMQVCGIPISDEELTELTELIKPYAEAMECHPTEFELITALAFEFFYRKGCDIVVLEVGLGGRLDATNVIDSALVSVITAIGLDHVAILGDTVEKIAFEKAGIIKPGTDVVLYPQQDSIQNVIKEIAQKNNAHVIIPDVSTIVSLKNDLDGQIFNYDEFLFLSIPLLGEHQLKNASMAVEVCKLLRKKGFTISDKQIHEGLKHSYWPGRFEALQRDPIFIVDGGHNPQCIGSIKAGIEAYLSGRDITFLVGVLADKDYREMLDIVAPYAKNFVAVTPNSPRAMDSKDLAKKLKEWYTCTVISCDCVPQGVNSAKEIAGKDGVVVAFGSLYMTGEIRECFGHTK